MNFYLKIFIGIGSLLLSMCLRAQEMAPSAENNEWVEEKMGADQAEASVLSERELSYWLQHPLQLHKVEEQELRQTGLLNEEQILNFFYYRKRYGELLDKYELQAIPGWDMFTIKKILPYVSFDRQVSAVLKDTRLELKGHQQLLVRYRRDFHSVHDEDVGKRYLGSPDRILCSYGFNSGGRYQAGFLAKKDAGEKLVYDHDQKGFDHYSFFLQANGVGKFSRIILGDYMVNLGQGLVQWQNLSFGKSGSIFNVKRQGESLKPYRSTGEFNFFRGAVIRYEFRTISGVVFISGRKLDAQLIDGYGGPDSIRVSSLNRSGYHRTALEWAVRKNLKLYSAGTQVKWRFSSGHMALNMVQHQFSLPFVASPAPYDHFGIHGSRFTNASIDYSATLSQVHVFGEVATCSRGGWAATSGLLASLDRRLDLALLYRHFAPSYHSFFSSAFQEHSEVENEKGFFAGFRFQLTKHVKLEGFLDLFQFPWIQSRMVMPGEGGEYWLKLDYTPARSIQFTARYRSYRNMIEGSDAETPLPGYEFQVKKQVRVQLNYQLTDKLSTQSRMEYIRLLQIDQAYPAEGFLSYMEVTYTLWRKRVAITLREQYHETTNYNTRVYAHEKDLNVSGSSKFFYGKGWRWYLHLAATPISLGRAIERPKMSLKIAGLNSIQRIVNQQYKSSPVTEGPIELGLQLLFFF